MTQVKIYGRGPIAIALVLFLRRHGVMPAQIQVEAIQAELPDAVASRPIALSEGSVQLLNRIIKMPGGAPIEQVDIGVLGHGLNSQLMPGDIGQKALGRVVRYGHLWQALDEAHQQNQRNSGHDFAEPGNDDALQIDEALPIIADGKPDSDANIFDFGQAALTTELLAPPDSRMPAPGIAYERFKPDGPLALLPLPEPGRIALVWCLSSEGGSAMLEATPAAFEQALSEQLGPRFSCMTLSAVRYLTPLQRSTQKLRTDSSQLRLGNAAQTLHPVAGQGMNLGLRDAFEVAAIVADGLRSKASTHDIIRSAQKQRQTDRARTIALTDQLARIADQPRLGGLNNGATQSMTISLLDAIGPVRRTLAKKFVFGQRKPN